MYRTYLKNSLNIIDLRITSKATSPDIKYCNGLCQDYRSEKEFTTLEPLCTNCKHMIKTAIKQVKENKITIEQFKENPEIINGVDIVYDTGKKCTICKETKNINQFDCNKSQCKACRAIKASDRNNKDIDILCSDIEKVKTDLHKLENFVQSIPKDRLIKVISHFEIGRKSSDRKDKMIFNIVEHFRKIQKPTLCLGGCGFDLGKEFSYCKTCEEKKEKPRRAEKMVNFEDNLDDFIETLVEVTEDMKYKYNKSQFMMIAKKLNVKLNSKDRKDKIITLISAELNKRKEDKQKLSDSLKETNISKREIELNGIFIESREDGYINATSLCKAGGKQFKHWNSLDSTKKLISTLCSVVGISTTELVDIKQGGDPKLQGSWIHPDLAIQLAQWISALFALKVSRWVRELALTGSVFVGNEKTEEQLLSLQNEMFKKEIKTLQNKCEKYDNLEIQHQELQNKHKKLLRKREYHKFKKGPVFYIFSINDNEYKLGYDDDSIDTRLKSHRSSYPKFKLLYLVYTEYAHILETNMLIKFDKFKLEANHEYVIDIEIKNIIDSVNTLITFCNYPATFESQEEIDKYNRS